MSNLRSFIANTCPYSIGEFDRAFKQFDKLLAASSQPSKYPPFNIVRCSEDLYQIVLAVAGFSKTDINIVLENNILTITGSKKKETVEYVYHGISDRDFKKVFTLNENVKVNSAVVENGLLTIALEHKIPEAQKPVTIKIY